VIVPDLPTVDASQFGSAIVDLTWARNKDTGHLHFVFGLVEMVPNEVPMPDAPTKSEQRLGGSSAWTLHHHRLTTDSESTLRWYSLASEGRWTAPTNGHELHADHPTLGEQRIPGPAQEPTWPSTVVHENSRGLLPFLPRAHACARLHHVLSTAEGLRDLLKPGERERLVGAVRKLVGIDIDRPGHLWQSLHLVAPNAMLRRVGTRLSSSDETGDAGVVVTVTPRWGQALDGLSVHVTEVRATGTRTLARFRPTSTTTLVPVTETVDQIEVSVEQDGVGTIHHQGPYTFIRSVHTTLGLVSRHRRIATAGSGKRSGEAYQVAVTGSTQQSVMGTAAPLSAAQKLRQASRDIASLSSAEESNQTWFDGDASDAARVIRGLIGRAQRVVRLVDGYFGAPEVLRFLPAAGLESAAIQVLTSRAGLKQRGHLIDGEGRRTLSDQLIALRNELDTAVSSRNINRTEVRVMRGRPAPIHDRFLQVDEQVWLLGSSLTEFGARGTMLLKLHSPRAVLLILDDAWAEAPTLHEAITESPKDAPGGDEA